MRLEKGGQGTWHRWRAFGDRSLREKEVLPHPSQSTRWNKTSGSENRSPIHRLDQGATPVPGLRTWKGKRELERGLPSHWSCVGPQRDVKPCLSVPVLMRSLLGWQEDEVDRLPGRPVCTLEAHEASHGSSACRTRRLKTRPAPPGLGGPGWRDVGLAARPVGSVAQPESVHAVSHP